MSSAGSEVPDSFFKCGLCSETLTEPKLLNCLHRYCRECLVALGSPEIDCMECGMVTKVPIGGVRDLETDVHTKQVIECREAHQNILSKGKKKKECAICGHVKKCSFYCFKCTGLLCDDCHHLHLSNEQFKPHSTALINVKNVDATTLKAGFTELTRMMDAPRCPIHRAFLDIICYTCDKEDICMGCKFGTHKGHHMENMRDVAQRVRGEMGNEMISMKKPNGFWRALENRVRTADKKMQIAVDEMLKEAKEKVKQDLNVINAKRELMKEFKKRNSSRLSVCSDTSTVVESYDVNRLSRSISDIDLIQEDSGMSMSYDSIIDRQNPGVGDDGDPTNTTQSEGNISPTETHGVANSNEKRRTSSTDTSHSDGKESSASDNTMEHSSVLSSPTTERLIEEDLQTENAFTRSNSSPTRSKNGRSSTSGEETIVGSPLNSGLSQTKKDLRRSVSDSTTASGLVLNAPKLIESSFFGSLSELYSVNEDDVDEFTQFTQERMNIERYNDALVRFLENLKDSKLSTIFDGVTSLQKRYDNIEMTVKIIASTQHDWAALKCVPGVMNALKSLSSDMRNHQKNVGIVEQIKTKFVASTTLNHFGLIEISGSEVSSVNLEDFMGKEWVVRDACWVSGGRDIAISSHNKNGISQITLLSLKGRQSNTRQFNSQILSPWRFVAAMGKKMMVTASQPTELGVYNSDLGVYVCKDLREITPKWFKRRWVQSIAVDRSEKNIFVGSGETDGHAITGTNKIEIYDYQLVHQRTLIIPQIACCPQGLAVNRGRLLVCDYYGKRALCCNAKDGILNYEFPNLELDEGGWQPFGVCVDNQGYIFILWDAKMEENWKQIVIRYSAEGNPLTMRTVDMNAMCIAITPSHDGNERLTVVDREKGEMTHYGIL